MKYTNSEVEEALKVAGAENIEAYTLINNHGFTFTKKGAKYDLRHILNVYGAKCDFWEIIAENKHKFESTNLPGLLEELKNI